MGKSAKRKASPKGRRDIPKIVKVDLGSVLSEGEQKVLSVVLKQLDLGELETRGLLWALGKMGATLAAQEQQILQMGQTEAELRAAVKVLSEKE